ncbi:hypothetical protein TI05_05495 [Achromatium sp. WMS3]|nr:hypothetical protein TI05_05495 [Achromatium sp. WMS3]
MKLQTSIILIAVWFLLYSSIGITAQSPGTYSPRKVVSPRALISQVEIAEYRRAIRNAPTREAAQSIREATYSRLRQRAAERGLRMSEPNVWYGGLHWGGMLRIRPHKKQLLQQRLLQKRSL